MMGLPPRDDDDYDEDYDATELAEDETDAVSAAEAPPAATADPTAWESSKAASLAPLSAVDATPVAPVAALDLPLLAPGIFQFSAFRRAEAPRARVRPRRLRRKELTVAAGEDASLFHDARAEARERARREAAAARAVPAGEEAWVAAERRVLEMAEEVDKVDETDELALGEFEGDAMDVDEAQEGEEEEDGEEEEGALKVPAAPYNLILAGRGRNSRYLPMIMSGRC